MANDYVGRYGAQLRALQSLNRGGFGSPAQPQQPASAFGGVQQGPRPGAFGSAPQEVPQNPLEPPAPAAAPADQPAEVSASQLWRDMPAEFKKQLEDQIASGGMDIDKTYAAKVDEGEIEVPKKEPTRQEKLGYLAEVALRTLSNLSRPGTMSISDFADAKLATDARRGAIETAEAERRRAAGEKRRQETRENEKEARRTALDLTERALTREGIASEGALSRKQAAEIAAEQRKERAADREERSKEAAAERKFRGEEGAASRKSAEDIANRRAFNQIDADTMVREKREAAKEIREDRKEMKAIEALVAAGKYKTTRDAIEARASEIVMGRLPSGTRPPSAATNPYDQFD